MVISLADHHVIGILRGNKNHKTFQVGELYTGLASQSRLIASEIGDLAAKKRDTTYKTG